MCDFDRARDLSLERKMIMKTKRVLSLALAISMALSLLILPANAASFTDVSGHWAEKLIEQAVAHGYVPAGGAFEPNKAITRNEFARMVNGAFGLTNAASISFSDVSISDPYYKDVQKAVSAGYIAGYEDNTFRGTNLITRQEAAVIIARLVAYPNAALKTMNLKDTSSIGAWALPAARIVFTKGYMVGDNLQKFNPLGNLTRAETVKILECILDGENIIPGNITINAKNDTIVGNIYTGNLIISDSIGRSSIQLTNCKVLGTLLVNGGGETGVRLSNTGVANMTIDSQYQQPGVAAVGDSTVYNTYLKTASQLVESNLSGMGAGFKNVTVGGTSAKVSLTGTTFDNVSINTPASLTLTSGKITNLTVGASAAGTSIKLEAGTNVANAALHAAAAISGKGTVTKTTTNSGTSTGTGTTVAGALAYTSTPAIGATKVATSAVVNISFEDAIVPTNGQTLTTSWVRSNVVLRENTATGATVDYSASISSNGKILTIDPVAALKTGTEYLLTVNANAFKGKTNGKANAAIAILFTTDGKSTSSSSSSSSIITDEMEPEFYPGDETDNFPVYGNLTLTFEDKVYDEDGKNLTSSYLKNKVIELHKGSENGTDVAFSASINSAKKVITINPSSNLTKNTTYYLVVKEGMLTNDDDDSNDELVYSFKTANSTGLVPLATPASGSTVETDTDFVFVFEGGVFEDNGDYLTSSYLENYVFEIREGSKTGSKIDFEADIDSDDETITLVTDELLDEDETYYVIMDGDDLSDVDGNTLPDLTFVYYADDVVVNNDKKPVVTGDLAPIETTPEHKQTGVKGSDDIKLLFGEDLYTSAGKKATSVYVEDCIEIRRNSESGSKISFNATYDTTYGLDIVELDPATNLSVGTKYYVIIKANTLFDKNGKANDKFVFYFTVGTSGTDEISVDVDPSSTSAKLTVDYDFSDYDDVDNIEMTVYYNKEGGTINTWKNVSYSINNASGTKVVNLTGLTKNTEYEFEVEVELYDGTKYITYESYADYFTTGKSSSNNDYYGDNAISSITVSSDNIDSISAFDIEEVDDGEFIAEIEDTITMNSDDILEIKINTYDSDATIWIESDEDDDYGSDNEWMEVEISSSEWDDGEVVLYITVEDGDGYETFYTLYIYID